MHVVDSGESPFRVATTLVDRLPRVHTSPGRRVTENAKGAGLEVEQLLRETRHFTWPLACACACYRSGGASAGRIQETWVIRRPREAKETAAFVA